MNKKIIILIFLFIVFAFGLIIGKLTNNDEITGKTSSNENTEENNVEENFENKLENSIGCDAYKINVEVNAEDFKDIYYKIKKTDDTILFIKKDGTIFEYSSKKFSSTNLNTKKYSSKLDKKVIMGFANFDKMNNDNQVVGEYWFLLEDYSWIRFDSINDIIYEEKEVVNDGWGRVRVTPQIIKYMKDENDNGMVISWSDHLEVFIIANQGKISIYRTSGSTDDKKIESVEERQISENESIEIVFSDSFIKTNNGYYKYVQTNITETNEFVDVEPTYAFEKINTSEISGEIIYFDNQMLVNSQNEVYVY